MAKSRFYLQVLNDAKGNSKEIWKNINNLAGRKQHYSGNIQLKFQGKITEDSVAIASIFNSFFIESVRELGNHFKKRELTIHSNKGQGFTLAATNEEQVKKIIHSLKTSKSRDAFYMDSMLIKKHSDTLTTPITHLINVSIAHSCFPDNWKHAVVSPIFKSGDRCEASNYRPISILPTLSKVAEKVVIEQLTTHLNNCNPGLNDMQFGFRKNHCTETAVLHFTERIRTHLDKGGVAAAVFLDLRKAFDTVNHDVLISKLSNFNLSAQTLAWLSSYRSNRMQ